MSMPIGICASAYTPTWTEEKTARRDAEMSKWSIASTPATPREVRPVIARM